MRKPFFSIASVALTAAAILALVLSATADWAGPGL
jgi:hypothetical protein